MEKIKKPLAALLSLLLLTPLFPTSFAAQKTVEIRSVEDFNTFAEECVRDVWSLGVTVELLTDLDFTGQEFTPVPYFQGVFHGNNHIISGFSLDAKGSRVGLFRTLTRHALVEDLSVEGSITLHGTASRAGLLAGECDGAVRRVVARGTVTGKSDVGGLVGCCGENGRLESCISYAAVSGTENTGGIVGENLGTVLSSLNCGPVNTGDNQKTPLNTGGIAGRTEGVVRDSVNQGEVGYPHIGYNVGGVAGLQTGEITGCQNYSAINGRKDVGGITGQLEPLSKIVSNPSSAENLNQNLSALLSQTQDYLDTLDSMVGRGSSGLHTIHQSVGAIKDAAHQSGSGSGRPGNFLPELLRITQALSPLLKETRPVLSAYLDNTQTDAETIKNNAETLSGFFAGLPAENEAAGIQKEAADRIKTETENLRKELRLLSAELDALSLYCDAVQRKSEEGSLTADSAPPLPPAKPWERVQNAKTALGALGSAKDTLFSGWETAASDEEAIRSAAEALLSAADRLISASSAFFTQSDAALTSADSYYSELKALYGSSSGGSGDLGPLLDEIDKQTDIIQREMDSILSGAGQDRSHLQSLSDQMLVNLDAIRASLYHMNKKPELSIKDQSLHVTRGPGVLSDCRSESDVLGDSNVGGILGSVSVEVTDNPETTLPLEEIQLLSDTYVSLIAAIRNCRFDGDVSVRNDCGGGIVGRAEAGAIVDSAARGTVSVGTDYCGGIVGRTKGTVLRSAALIDLSGEGWIGGVAGLGKDMTNCRVMVHCQSFGEYSGAIAGETDGILQGNCYLMESLAGVDGVDYAGKAEGLDFPAFSKLQYIPVDFLTLSYRFVVEGETVAEIPFSYGDDLDLSLVPPSPQSGGKLGLWPEFPTENLTRSMVLEAYFEEPADTISWGGEIPELLAEGAFLHEAALTAKEEPLPGDLPEIGTPLKCYSYEVTGARRETVTLRLRAADVRHPVAAICQNGQWTVIKEAQQDGSYLVFEAPLSGQLLLAEGRSPAVLPIVAAVAGGALLLAAGILFLKKKPKKEKASEKESPEAEPPEEDLF